MGHKPVTDFSNLAVDIDISSHTHHQGITHSLQEGLQDDKSENPDYPQSILDYVLHPQHKPKHHKPDLVRAVGYTLNTQGKLVKILTYRGQRQIKIIECKYSIDGNIQTIIDHIYDIYEQLRLALQTYGTLKAEVKMIPIVISQTGTIHVETLAVIAQLVSFKEEPPDDLTFKQPPPRLKESRWHSTYMHKNGYLTHLKPRERSS